MSQSYQRLTERFHRLAQIDHANFVLGWDQMVMMPPGGVEARGIAVAELRAMRHELLTQDDMSDLLDAAEAELPALAPDQRDIQAASVGEMRRSCLQASAIPASLVKAKVLAGTRCEHAWRTQRSENDWQGFLENFREVVTLSREEARCRQAADTARFNTPYDALLDLYCSGDSQALIGELFASLKERLPILLQRIMEHQKSINSGHRGNPVILQGRFAVESQIELNRRLMSCLGFDFESGRLDVSMHPFSTGVAGDQRITTRFRETDIADALQATAHETGHASYESGLPSQFRGQPVGRSRNMCLHESQSLLFEKHLFLSLPFLEAFISDVHDVFPHTSEHSALDFWQSLTVVNHMLAESDFPLPEEFDEAYEYADLLVFETDIASMALPETQAKFAQQLTYTDGSQLSDYITGDTYDSVKAYLTERGLPSNMLDAYKPGLAMTFLTIIELQRLGMAGIGVDQYYSDKASNDNKRTDGLESIDQQISFLVAIGEAEPDAVLQYTIGEMNKLEKVMVDIKRDWRRGVYTTSLDKFLHDMKMKTPELYVKLMQYRNEAWLDQIETLMATPATEFVMVGVAHLAGEDSLLDMLENLGYQIEPL